MKDIKFRKRYFIIIATLLAGILFLAGTLFVQNEIKRQSSPSSIAAMLSRKLGCPVSIEKAQLDPMGTLVVEKISIVLPKDLRSDDEVASIPKATVTYNPLLSLWRREAAVNTIELEEPRVTLSKSFLDWQSKRPDTVKGTFPPILIKSGSLRIDFGDKGKEWAFDEVKGRVMSRKGGYRAELTGTSVDSSESWKFDGTFSRDEDQEFKLTIGKLDMAKAAKRFSFAVPVRGKADITIEAPKARELSLKGTFESDTLQVKKAIFTRVKSQFKVTGTTIALENLEGKIYQGQFKGQAEISQESRGPLFGLEGELSGISLAEARELEPQ